MSRAKRAKKSIIPKLLFLMILVAGMIFAILNYRPEIESGIAKMTNSIGGTEVKTYYANDYVNDYVKAIFTDVNGTRYIPVVYERYDKQITASDIRGKFAEYGIEITSIPDTIVNGSTVNTANATYKVLIYGDVNCDGRINVIDAQRIVLHVVNNGKGSNALTDIKALAANIQNVDQNVINVLDAKRIVDFVLSNSTIVEKLPASDISKDKEKPEITLNGDETVTVVKGKEYNELGASVTDDTDPNVKVVITYPEPINTSVVGEYEVIYTAKDMSGKESKKIRTVIVEEENTPVITFDDEGLGDKISVNIASDADDPNDEAVKYFNDLKSRLGASATDKKDGKLNVNVEGLDDVDLSKPGEYILTYTSDKNSQGNRGRRIRIIEVVDRVYKIVLNGNATESYVFNEGDTIELDKLTATIYRISGRETGEHEYNVPVSQFGTGKYKDFALEITENATGSTPITTATYIGAIDPSDPIYDNTTANRELTAKAIWTNPAPTSIDEYKSVESSLVTAGRMTVIGNIREIVEDPDFGAPHTSGEKYELLEVARLTTKRYQQKLTSSNLKLDKVTVVDANGEKIPANQSNVNVKLDFETKPGVASIKFWATEIGTYSITLKLDTTVDGVNKTITKVIDNIRVTASTKADLIKPVYLDSAGTELYEGVLKVNGAPKEFGLKFQHTYGSKDTAEVTEDINITADKISVEFENINGTKDSSFKYEILADSNRFVTGIKIIPPITANVPDNSYLEKKIVIYLDSTVSATSGQLSKEDIIKLYPESIYTVSYGVEDLTLYLKNTGANLTYHEGNIIYTLVPAKLVDQYSDRDNTSVPFDPSEKEILAEMLSTNHDDLDVTDSIVLRDGAAIKEGTHSFIEVAGFNEAKSKIQNGKIKYIGIALKDNNLGDEDKQLEAEPFINTYYVSENSSGSNVTTMSNLELNNIVKKDITTFTVTTKKSTDYCYENSIVANISTGPWEEDLLDLNSVTLSIVQGPDDAIVSKELNTIKVGEESKADGTVNIRLDAPNPGDYKIKATLNEKTGSTWVPTTKTTSTDIIKITDNPVITSVAFSFSENYLNNGEVDQKKPSITTPCANGETTQFGKDVIDGGATKNGSVRQSKTELHKIVYYHDYYRGNIRVERRMITDTDLMPSNSSITVSNNVKLWSSNKTSYEELTMGSNSLVISKANGTNILPSSERGSYVDGIAVHYSNSSYINKYFTFDVTINQSKYGADDFTFSVGVNTIRQAMISDVKLESLNKDKTFNLYEDISKATANGDTIFKDGGNNYTVFKICYFDEDYDEVPILAADISNVKTNYGEKVVWILDDLGSRKSIVEIVTLAEKGNDEGFIIDESNSVTYVGIAPGRHPISEKLPSQLKIYLNSNLRHTINLNVFEAQSEENTTPANVISGDKKVPSTSGTGGKVDSKVDQDVNTPAKDDKPSSVVDSNNTTNNETSNNVESRKTCD